MHNIFLNLCKFFKFVLRILIEKMSPVTEQNAKKIGMNSNLYNLGTKDNTSMTKLSLKDLQEISDELERVINYLKNSTNMEYFLYDYPGILEARITDNILELESLLKEIKSVNTYSQQQNQQQILFAKEKASLKKILKKLKDKEIHEMETVISRFDKTMFTQWESVKDTRKPEVLERFLSDVMSKQLALDNLNALVSYKLTNLRKYPKEKCSSTKKNDTSTPTPLPNGNTPDVSKIPPPPPLPPLPTWLRANYTSCNLPSHKTDASIRIESIDEELD